jgi:hypothetical protein
MLVHVLLEGPPIKPDTPHDKACRLMTLMMRKASTARKQALSIEQFDLSDTLPDQLREFADAMEAMYKDLLRMTGDNVDDSNTYKPIVEVVTAWFKFYDVRGDAAKSLDSAAKKRRSKDIPTSTRMHTQFMHTCTHVLTHTCAHACTHAHAHTRDHVLTHAYTHVLDGHSGANSWRN